MRVVAGVAKGRLLRAPAGRCTRPTSDRVREAVFSMLASMDAVEGAAVADLFAGSGALGIEALSRGAASATFVDSAQEAVAAIRSNLAVLSHSAVDATVVRADVPAWAAARAAAGAPELDLTFADPPYAWGGWPTLLRSLRLVGGLVVAETGSPWAPVAGWETVRTKRYGSTVVTVLATHEGGGGR